MDSLTPTASTKSYANDAVKLHAQGICKFYDATAALNPIELKILAGELLTLLGPSGSGKTTLLQLIAGLVKPTSGRLMIDGRDQTDLEPYKRDIGVVFQNYSLFPHLTVQENIAFPLQMRGQSDRVSATQVSNALEMVGLERFGKRFPHELSGGQQQRVALARCLVYKPSLILMDESLSALDRKLREAMQVEIKRIHRETSSTIIFVTHDQEEALALSDRICLMNNGAIEQLGTPLELYDKPKTVFAATFIGTSNVVSGQLANAAQISSDISERLIDIGGDCKKVALGQPCSIAIRPENVRIGDCGAGILNGTIIEEIYAGSETRMMVELPNGSVFTVRVPGGAQRCQLGENVSLTWDPQHVRILES
ncbi:ABC transporter ATP-binding protein [Bradyrhizobium sp. BRP22]|uniref:ABC transporter ATP-binding protein n=1 Tax=Bradyrhizobium sp. BRP22 TaxID=2793821 RepID=UPI001CD788C7|nr:ABC transporter ATP-binding protein [Bradyrhizobium sp. BRP22]MCA1453005.1 ABC transporter ATP-binding protein [Bradyrhizobium sp. BRP22]